MINSVLKTVSPFSNVKTLLICHLNRKNTLAILVDSMQECEVMEARAVFGNALLSHHNHFQRPRR